MKLVIEIDEEVAEHAKEQSEDSNDEWKAMRAIANGTPFDEVLDKIRAEIESEYQESDATRCEEYDDGYCLGLQTALQIIDKYTKGEGE